MRKLISFCLVLLAPGGPLALASCPGPAQVSMKARLVESDAYGVTVHPGWERDLELGVDANGAPTGFVFGEETGRELTAHTGISAYVAHRFSIVRRETIDDGDTRYLARELTGTPEGRTLIVIDASGRGGGWQIYLWERGGTVRRFSGQPRPATGP